MTVGAGFAVCAPAASSRAVAEAKTAAPIRIFHPVFIEIRLPEFLILPTPFASLDPV
jgi:hypothetical protein